MAEPAPLPHGPIPEHLAIIQGVRVPFSHRIDRVALFGSRATGAPPAPNRTSTWSSTATSTIPRSTALDPVQRQTVARHTGPPGAGADRLITCVRRQLPER
jgi:hypothetical protein